MILLAAGIMMFSIITFITSFQDNCVITLWPLFTRFSPLYKYHLFSFHAPLCAPFPTLSLVRPFVTGRALLICPMAVSDSYGRPPFSFVLSDNFFESEEPRMFCFITLRLFHQATALF